MYVATVLPSFPHNIKYQHMIDRRSIANQFITLGNYFTVFPVKLIVRLHISVLEKFGL